MISSEIIARLEENADAGYKAFHAKLIPNVSPDRIIGVRTPVLRKLAKEFSRREDIGEFLADLPHGTYDENNLHGFIIAEIKDYDREVEYLDKFLPHIDNWATCDLLRPRAFAKNRTRLSQDIERWLKSDEVYTIRFGIEMIMTHFLDGDFDEKYLEAVADVRSDEFYVNMMIAWFFATALAKQWDHTIKYIDGGRLNKWTHNKTISKACESYRITDEQKDYLKSKRIK